MAIASCVTILVLISTLLHSVTKNWLAPKTALSSFLFYNVVHNENKIILILGEMTDFKYLKRKKNTSIFIFIKSSDLALKRFPFHTKQQLPGNL